MGRGLPASLALAVALLAGCAAPPDPLWHEELDARVTKWDLVDDELRLIAEIDAPESKPADSQLSLTIRIDELRVAEAAIDVPNGKLIYEERPGGKTAVEFRARLVQSGLATEPIMSVSGQAGLTFRGPALSARVLARPAKPVKKAAPWEHPQVPGLRLTIESWDESAIMVSVERPPGGVLELHVQAGGERVQTEELRVAALNRLGFRDACPLGAELIAVWRAERRCLARLEAEDLPAAAE